MTRRWAFLQNFEVQPASQTQSQNAVFKQNLKKYRGEEELPTVKEEQSLDRLLSAFRDAYDALSSRRAFKTTYSTLHALSQEIKKLNPNTLTRYQFNELFPVYNELGQFISVLAFDMSAEVEGSDAYIELEKKLDEINKVHQQLQIKMDASPVKFEDPDPTRQQSASAYTIPIPHMAGRGRRGGVVIPARFY
jgi:hypothetical protein